MKKLRLAICALGLVAFFVLSAFVSERAFEITVPRDYSFAYSDESKSELAEKLGMATDKLDDFFIENNVEYLAVGEDKQSQVRVCIYEDDFSIKTENLSGYSNKEIKKLAKQIVKDTSFSFDIYKRDAKKYIKITESSKDSGGEFTTTQFITVADGKIFNISFFNSGKEFDKSNLKTLDTFEIKNDNKGSKMPILITVLITLGIASLVTVITLMIFGIIKDKKEENED